MYNFISKPKRKFDVETAYVKIAGAAFSFQSEDKLHIWIYLVEGELQFHRVELKPLSRWLVAHYPCQKIISGFSSFEWNRLGRKLAKVHFSTTS